MHLNPKSIYDFEYKSILTSLDYIIWSWKGVSFYFSGGDNNHIKAAANGENNG